LCLELVNLIFRGRNFSIALPLGFYPLDLIFLRLLLDVLLQRAYLVDQLLLPKADVCDPDWLGLSHLIDLCLQPSV
jgi:hypothetical protein